MKAQTESHSLNEKGGTVVQPLAFLDGTFGTSLMVSSKTQIVEDARGARAWRDDLRSSVRNNKHLSEPAHAGEVTILGFYEMPNLFWLVGYNAVSSLLCFPTLPAKTWA